MDIYHSWIYVNVLNAPWFLWSIVTIVFAFNIFAVSLIWILINGGSLPFLKSSKKKNNKRELSKMESSTS